MLLADKKVLRNDKKVLRNEVAMSIYCFRFVMKRHKVVVAHFRFVMKRHQVVVARVSRIFRFRPFGDRYLADFSVSGTQCPGYKSDDLLTLQGYE